MRPQPQPQLSVPGSVSRDTITPKPVVKPMSLSEAFERGPVDFKGRKLASKTVASRPKVEINVDELRKVLEESMGKNEK